MFEVVLIANDNHPIPNWVGERLGTANINYMHHECYGRKDLEECAVDADVLWLMSGRSGLVVEENMDIFHKLGAVVRCGSGTDNIDHSACSRRGIVIAHTPDTMTEPTSDHIIALLFTAVRQIARHDRAIRRGEWDSHAALPLGRFTGADLGLVGFGRIGHAIARKLIGFQMRIRVFDPYVDAGDIEAAGAEKVEFYELLGKSQFVLVACPLTDETKMLIGRRELEWMRRDAVLVNGARAGIVDEEALVEFLREGRIKGAALDVLSRHPSQPDDPLLSLETLTMTPHVGGTIDDYPNGIFASPVQAILDLSRMRLPKFIANKGVVPRWPLLIGGNP